jgi:hypothetical protein
MSKKVTNTATQDPMMTLLLLSGGIPGRQIEAQEAQGQRELVAAEVLPTEGLQAVASACGIEILGAVAGDELFVSVKLPDGWSKRATDHSMWSDLVDGKGRKRASIFYKAAFYDRRAFIRPCVRFSIEQDYDRRDAAVMHVKDVDRIVYTSQAETYDAKNYDDRDRAEVAARAHCLKWLADHGYPDYMNPAAYWDDPASTTLPTGEG